MRPLAPILFLAHSADVAGEPILLQAGLVVRRAYMLCELGSTVR